jgi:hypothetical protein
VHARPIRILPKAGRVVRLALCGHEVAHRNWQSLIGHAEVRVYESVDQPSCASLVESGRGMRRGAPVHDHEAAPARGCPQ